MTVECKYLWYKRTWFIIPTILICDISFLYRHKTYLIEFKWLGLNIMIAVRGKKWDENL